MIYSVTAIKTPKTEQMLRFIVDLSCCLLLYTRRSRNLKKQNKTPNYLNDKMNHDRPFLLVFPYCIFVREFYLRLFIFIVDVLMKVLNI